MLDADRIREIFNQAVTLEGDARAAFLLRACGDDATVRAKVESLLHADDVAGGFLTLSGNTLDPSGGPSASADDRAAVADLIQEKPGARIGPYKLLQEIGEGGFGSVFMAEQEHPVRRRVALKIIKLGMDTREVVARFEQERQALAMMDHPHIAKVFDAGSTSTGRPFFVMELCKGEAITDYCDKHNLNIEQRIELFAQVCSAVQHAHTKGIIHRDIKPSNVLVTSQDGDPHAKVIDFGIAKATASSLTEKTLFTQFNQMIGTPQYMSPEQAAGSTDIDTRTDVYALGVLLYELLTGVTPFDPKRLRSAAYAEMQRIIREVDPPNPSTRLVQNTDMLASVAAHRQLEPARLGTIVRGELDWIVMKALEKNRQRRYESASSLGMDLQRYLNDEAVLAAPASTIYRLRKVITRNKGKVTAAAVVAAALVLGMVGTAWQARRANRERDIAVAAREGETRQRKTAEAERDKSAKIAAFMSETLDGVGPSVARGRDITMLKEMMDTAAARIENGDLKSSPEAELRLRGTIGDTYKELALYADSARMLDAALPLARSLHGDSIYTANALTRLAQLRAASGDAAGAEVLFREALAMERQLYPEGHANLAGTLGNLAVLLQTRGDLAGAEPLYREALSMMKRLATGDNQDVAGASTNLAFLLQARGDFGGAEPFARESLEMTQRMFPGDHPDVANSLNNLGYLLYSRGEFVKAEPLYRESLDMLKRLFPAGHPLVANGLRNLAVLLSDRGDTAAADAMFRESLEMRRRVLGDTHPVTLVAIYNFANRNIEAGRYAEAEPLVDLCVGGNAARFGPTHANTQRAIAQAVLLHESWEKLEPGKGHGAKAAEWKNKMKKPEGAPPPIPH